MVSSSQESVCVQPPLPVGSVAASVPVNMASTSCPLLLPRSSGHFYSNPSNWMWRILRDTGIAPAAIRGAEDDGRIPEVAGVVSMQRGQKGWLPGRECKGQMLK